MGRRTALVVGALGVIGRYLVDHLAALGEWDIIGLSRRRPDDPGPMRHIQVDLLDKADCAAKLGDLGAVTHVFYAAYLNRGSWADDTAPNRAMMANLLDALDGAAPNLERFVLMEGTKYYGSHLGPYRTPAKESDPRHMPPNFYFDQEDLVIERQRGKRWTWSALRPQTVCGFSLGSPMNLVMVIAVYATISKELGLPLRFPGKPGAYTALYQATDSAHLAKAALWAAESPNAANEAFNITNGDYFRWQHLWPVFADFFGMAYAPPQTICLAEMMADKGPLWERIVEKYGLVPHRYEDIVAWPFGDYVFACEWDVMSSLTKIRRAGFHDVVDSEEMFLRIFGELRAARIIP